LQIVVELSAKLFGNNVTNISMSCNHVNLCKFSSPTSARFEDLWGQLNLLVAEALEERRAVLATEADLAARFSQLSEGRTPSSISQG